MCYITPVFAILMEGFSRNFYSANLFTISKIHYSVIVVSLTKHLMENKGTLLYYIVEGKIPGLYLFVHFVWTLCGDFVILYGYYVVIL